MPDQLQLRGGTTAQHASFTGASKEITIDTTKKTVVVHDGSIAGGNPVMREDGSNSSLALGSASSPSLKWDANTGIYSPGADQVAVATNGTGRLFIDASGHVGINTSAPTNGFTSIIFKSTSGSAPVHIYADTAYWGLFDNGGTTGGYAPGNGFAGHATNNYLNLFTAGSERLRITSAGLVGIGTSSPGQLLDVAGVARFGVNATKLTTYSDSTYAGFFNGSSLASNESIYMGGGNTFFYNNGSPSVTIDSIGRVGIGTTSVGHTLEVRPSSNDGNLFVGNASGPGVQVGYSGGGAASYLQAYNTTASAFVDLNVNGSTLRFGTGSGATERARIDSSGRLLVGTSSSTGSLSNTAPVIAGLFQSFDDVATFTTGVAQTLFVIPNTNATYIVTLRRGSVGDAANYEAVSILSTNSGGSVSAVLTDLKTAANVLISISGTNLQGTQSSGGNASLRWVVTRVG